MTRARLRLALVALTLSGCAVLRGGREATPERQLAEGLAAVEARDYERARGILDPLYRAHWDDAVGREAMLALIAAELDSRNPERRLSAAADLSARYLNIEDIPRWQIPVVESLYLIAQELGANEERIARAEADAQQAHAERAQAQRELEQAEQAGGRRLPTTTRESVPQRIGRLRAERDSLQRRLAATEQRLAARETELNDVQTELERIRKTLKP